MKIRIALAQINPTVGDFEGNVRAVRRMTAEAKKRGAQIVAFPELVLCGYPPEDLLLKPRFLKDSRRALRAVAREAKGIVMLVGAPEPPARPGERPLQRLPRAFRREGRRDLPQDQSPELRGLRREAVLRAGRERARRELRRSSPSERASARTSGSTTGRRPRRCFSAARGIIINISASPYHRRKGREREKLMQRRARENGCWLCYSTSSEARTSLSSTGAA